MTATYTGHSFDITDLPCEVKSAVVTKKRIDLEWIEGSYIGNLVATSDDGFVYEGTFSYRGWPDESNHARLGCYRGANGAILLFGEWWETNNPVGITWLIQLVPKPE